MLKQRDNDRNWLHSIFDEPDGTKRVRCAHLNCPECHGSGMKGNGTSCVHMISCRCKQCSSGRLM